MALPRQVERCSVSMDMVRHRFTVLLPTLSAIIASVLWISARTQYHVLLSPHAGTPPSIQAVGMQNMPVAVFADPLDRLVQSDVRRWQLLAFLLGVVTLWSYIGWRVDTRNVAPRPTSLLRVALVILGCVLAFFVFVQGVRNLHVGLLYKFAAISWSFLMLRHFGLLLHTPPVVPETTNLSTKRRLPRLTIGIVALCWAVVLVAVFIAPINPSGRPTPSVTKMFAVCCGVLAVATVYAVLAYLVKAWRKIPPSRDKVAYVVWVGFETYLAVSAVASMAYVSMHVGIW